MPDLDVTVIDQGAERPDGPAHSGSMLPCQVTKRNDGGLDYARFLVLAEQPDQNWKRLPPKAHTIHGSQLTQDVGARSPLTWIIGSACLDRQAKRCSCGISMELGNPFESGCIATENDCLAKEPFPLGCGHWSHGFGHGSGLGLEIRARAKLRLKPTSGFAVSISTQPAGRRRWLGRSDSNPGITRARARRGLARRHHRRSAAVGLPSASGQDGP